jgi:uncharacterized damage-inducible protein DinB
MVSPTPMVNNVFHLHLREMCEYLRWSDQQSLLSARTVRDDDYYKELGISVGSVHKLLVHCMAAEWLWLCRFRGESPTKVEDHADYPTRMNLEQRWPLVHAALIDFVGRMTPQQMGNPVTYHDTKGNAHTLPLRDMILHLIDHGSYHRGQLATMIKKAGGTPANISFRTWALERAKRG